MAEYAKTPLCEAILMEDPQESYDMVSALLEAGEDPNRADEWIGNIRPLYLAWGEESDGGKQGFVKLLIKHGAVAHPEEGPLDDVLMANAPLSTTLSIFRLGHSFQEYLTETEREPLCTENPLSYLLSRSRFKAIESLMEFDMMCLLNAFNIDGETVLAEMARDGNIGNAQWLLNIGADVNASSYIRVGNTPLDYAVEKRNLEMVQFLLDAGANPNIPTNMSVTAAMRADMQFKELRTSETKQIAKLVSEASSRFPSHSD